MHCYGNSMEASKTLPYDAAAPLLGMYLNELKAGSQTDICIPKFTVA
jgi:hypothetical protein